MEMQWLRVAFDIHLLQFVGQLSRQCKGHTGLHAKPLGELAVRGGPVGGEIAPQDLTERLRSIDLFPAIEPLAWAHECHLVALVRPEAEQAPSGSRPHCQRGHCPRKRG